MLAYPLAGARHQQALPLEENTGRQRDSWGRHKRVRHLWGEGHAAAREPALSIPLRGVADHEGHAVQQDAPRQQQARRAQEGVLVARAHHQPADLVVRPISQLKHYGRLRTGTDKDAGPVHSTSASCCTGQFNVDACEASIDIHE